MREEIPDVSPRPRIGELLVNLGLLGRDQLESALEQQRAQGTGGRRLGALLVDLGFISEVQLTKVLSQHLSVPWVSLHHIDFSRQLLNLVPKEIAEEFCVIPIYVRHERKVGDTLYLAMEDPTHDEAVRRVGEACGMPVKSMIAAPSDIRGAIRAFYGGAPPETASSPSKSIPAPPMTASAPPILSSAPIAPKPPPAPPKPPAKALEKRPSMPSQRAERAERPTLPEGKVAAAPDEKTTPKVGTAEKPTAASSVPAQSGGEPASEPADATDGPVVEITKETRLPSEPPAEASSDDAAHAVADEAHDTVPPAREDQSDAVSHHDVPSADAIPRAPRAPSLPAMPTPSSTVASRADATPWRAKASQMSASANKAGPRMLSLTLLDGTTIQIPSQKRSESDATPSPETETSRTHEQKLTTRDLISALRAVANGADPDEALGDARWETIVASLLAVLLRKQLISDWEFAEELHRRTGG